jgi:hypothetical protein
MDPKHSFFTFDALNNKFTFLGRFELKIQAVCHAPFNSIVVSENDLLSIIVAANAALDSINVTDAQFGQGH